LRQGSLPFDAPVHPRTAGPTPFRARAPGAMLFVRHPRARRYVLRVRPDGSVRVTIPRGGSRREAERFAGRQQAWIARQLRRMTIARARVAWESTASERELRARAARELPARLRAIAGSLNLEVRRVSVRNQRWRWGSCSRDGHICLNWRLIVVPERVRDYVMIHELMHLRRMDHSPAFWALVAAACPDYQEARRWLGDAALAAGPLDADGALIGPG
jgi:predicted metal-dependent hydrolase